MNGMGKGDFVWYRSKLPFHAVFQGDVKPLGVSLVEGHQDGHVAGAGQRDGSGLSWRRKG